MIVVNSVSAGLLKATTELQLALRAGLRGVATGAIAPGPPLQGASP